ncbi:MAG: hypothetical protein HYX68_01195 [Planctomycetes bacterium]|nr:hypothetical protein [Planctomycetota bacterium]
MNSNPANPSQAGGASRAPVVVAVLLLLAAGATAWWWWRPDLNWRQGPGDDDDIKIEVVNPGYVGIKACAECHAKRVKEFEGTRHFVACTPPSGIGAPGFKPGRGLHLTGNPKLRFEMTRSGADCFLTGIQNGPDGETRTQYQVGLVYGASGKSDEMYFCWQDNKLVVHPIGWLFPFERWGHGAETIFTRPVESRCIECHNTWIAHVPGTPNEYQRAGMHAGVTCERCHGPGQEHVVHHRAHPNDAAHAIVHPGMLSRERLMEVCTQCHSASFNRRGPAFSYRPGQPLDESFRVSHIKYQEDDLVGNQVQYLRESKCFQKSEMTCVTCHHPHRPQQHDSASQSCLECHKPASCKDHENLPAAVRGDCAGCHMPPRVWMGARFHTTDDRYVPVTARSEHRIAVYPEAKKTVLLNWLRARMDAKSQKEAQRLSEDLGQYWIDVSEKRRGQHRLLGVMQAMREAVKIDSRPGTRKRLAEAIARQAEFDRLSALTSGGPEQQPREMIAALHRLLEMKPDDAKAHGKLGVLLSAIGKQDEAVRNLQAVAKLDPNDSFGLSMLASMAYMEGRAEDAAALCAKADAIDPYDAKIHYLWGTALLKLDRVAEAGKLFGLTVTIDPRHALGNQAYSETLRRQGQAEKAVTYARKAARLTEWKSPEIMLTLADAYLAAQRPREAREALDTALNAALASNSPLAPSIRARLREMP